jgi:hypothetical protein
MYLYLHLDWWELMEASGLSWQLVTALHDEGEGLKTAIDFFFISSAVQQHDCVVQLLPEML